jgi:hypothetical protein
LHCTVKVLLINFFPIIFVSWRLDNLYDKQKHH